MNTRHYTKEKYVTARAIIFAVSGFIAALIMIASCTKDPVSSDTGNRTKDTLYVIDTIYKIDTIYSISNNSKIDTLYILDTIYKIDESVSDDAVAADKNDLSIIYASGDSANSITQNIGLPLHGKNGSVIIWLSNNTARITTNGTVSRPKSDSLDATVQMTALLFNGRATEMKVFSLVVKKIGLIVYSGTITDVDGNIYQTVKIGNQEWTAENIRTTHFRDGTPIPCDTSANTWGSVQIPKLCYYQNNTDPNFIKKYGALYNWYAVNAKSPTNLAPVGWHIPSDSEWKALENYLITNGYNWDGTVVGNKIAKSMAAKTDWVYYKIVGTIGNDLTLNNSSGFSALPGGYRYSGSAFSNFGDFGYWWSSTEKDNATAIGRNLCQGGEQIYYNNSSNKGNGFSIRLIKD